MARDGDGLRVRKWARTTLDAGLVNTPEADGLDRDVGYPASYGIDEFPALRTQNGLWKEVTALAKDIEAHGILEWSGLTAPGYGHPCLVWGSDGLIYKSVQAGGQVQDPTTDVTKTYWRLALEADVVRGIGGKREGQAATFDIGTDDDGKVIEVDASGGPVTANLPDLGATDNGFTVTAVKIDNSANVVTLDGNGADTINGAATLELRLQYEAVILKWTGSNWLGIGGASPTYVRAEIADVRAPLVMQETGLYAWPYADGVARAYVRAPGGGGGPPWRSTGNQNSLGENAGDITLQIGEKSITVQGGRAGGPANANTGGAGGAGGDAGDGDIENVDGIDGTSANNLDNQGYSPGGGEDNVFGSGGRGGKSILFPSGGGGGQGAYVVADFPINRGQIIDIDIGAPGTIRSGGLGGFAPGR